MTNIPSKEKDLLKRFLPKAVISFFRKMVYPEKINLVEENLNSLFFSHYRGLAAPGFNQKTAIKNAEFKVCSKNGGDGILLHIFSKIGITDRTFVELGVEDGRECNTANLSFNFGWQGMIVDADKEKIEIARSYYSKNSSQVKPVHCFITADNINKLLLDNGFRGEIDLFSIDIDGNDYWVWREITAINPRVVVAEYNAALGLKSMTIKYNPDFHYQKRHKETPMYFGASLAALTKLADSRGYILVGCDSNGHDAFFVRKDVAEGKFTELAPENAFYPNPHAVKTVGNIDKQFEQIKHLDFENI